MWRKISYFAENQQVEYLRLRVKTLDGHQIHIFKARVLPKLHEPSLYIHLMGGMEQICKNSPKSNFHMGGQNQPPPPTLPGNSKPPPFLGLRLIHSSKTFCLSSSSIFLFFHIYIALMWIWWPSKVLTLKLKYSTCWFSAKYDIFLQNFHRAIKNWIQHIKP